MICTLYSDGSFKKRPYRVPWQRLLKCDIISAYEIGLCDLCSAIRYE
jgi:hypothetical protein